MNITYNYLVPAKSEKLALTSAGESATVTTSGSSAVIKVTAGSAFICGKDCEVTEDCFILEEGAELRFSGILKILSKVSGFEARILYFDSL